MAQDTNANGSQGNGSAVVSVHRSITLQPGTTTTGAVLTDLQTFCRNLPWWTAYFFQAAGAAAAQVKMQFSVDDVWNGATMVPQFFDEASLAPLTVGGPPTFISRRMAVNYLRPVITNPGLAAITVDYILCVSL